MAILRLAIISLGKFAARALIPGGLDEGHDPHSQVSVHMRQKI
jgi:hypothetical protein